MPGTSQKPPVTVWVSCWRCGHPCLGLRPHASQVWTAGQNAGNAGQMVHARLDVPRFAKLNSVKGRWALLDDIDTVPVQQQTAGQEPGGAVAQPRSQGIVSARPALQKDAVVRIVREVAAGIISVAHLAGMTAQEPLHGQASTALVHAVIVCSCVCCQVDVAALEDATLHRR